MAARTVAANKAALARAREAREKLDSDRRAQEQRQDEATATALVALGELEAIDAVRNAKVVEVGAAIRALEGEGVATERAAGLLSLDVAEVRRLLKVAPPEPSTPEPSTPGSGNDIGTEPPAGDRATVTPLAEQDGSVVATRRAG